MAENTHYYDYKLSDTITGIESLLKHALSVNTETKLKAFQELPAVLKSTGNARSNLETIIRDFTIFHEKGPNYDPTNGLLAGDLLYLVYEMIVIHKPKDGDAIKLINELLAEMSSGMCSQGRCYRLLHFVLAFAEYYPSS